MKTALLLFHLASPVQVHCHRAGDGSQCYATASDNKPHVLQLETGAAIIIRGSLEHGFSSTAPITQIEIDGKTRKVKP